MSNSGEVPDPTLIPPESPGLRVASPIAAKPVISYQSDVVSRGVYGTTELVWGTVYPVKVLDSCVRRRREPL